MSAITNFKSTINGKIIDLGDIASQQTTHTIQISSNDPPGQRYSINFKRKVAIKTSDITVNINGALPTGSQRITFGPRKQDIYVAGSVVATAGVGNTLSFSNDGITWYGLGSSVIDTNSTGICYNGKIWVATNNTTTGLHALAYSYNAKRWIGLGNVILKTGLAVAWNGTMFVAGGQGPSIGTGNTMAYSYDGINWTGLGAAVLSQQCRGIVWNGRTWVACGSQTGTVGQTAFSTDGITWSTSPTSSIVFGSGVRCVCVAWNGYTWLGVGDTSGNGNTIAYSMDGNVWVPVPSSMNYITKNGFSLAWNGKIWVAGGDTDYTGNNIAYTADPLGRTGWVPLGLPVFGGTLSIKWTGKQFIATGSNSTGGIGNTTAYSSDGINWVGGGSQVMEINQGGRIFEYNNKGIHSITLPQFMVHSGTHYSNDGRTWNSTNIPTGALNACPQYNGKIWIAPNSWQTGLNYQYISYDGINWLTSNINIITKNGFVNLAWNGIVWAALGVNASTLYYSYDGISWKSTGKSIAGGQNRGDIKYNGKMFIAVASNSSNYGYSYNGIDWTISNNNVSGIFIAYNSNIWTTGTLYSYNGITWYRSPSPVTGTAVSGDWNGSFFTTCTISTGIWLSYDGIIWTRPYASSQAIWCNRWSGSMWNAFIVTTGTTGTAINSYNGINWNTQTTINAGNAGSGVTNFGTTYNIQPIPYIQHPAIAVGSGDNNTIAYSDDGINWTGLGKTIFSIEGYDVFWNGQIWVAAGNGGNSLAYSRDGISWTGLGTSVFTSGSAVAHNGNIWVATGSGANTLAYSTNGINWTGLGRRIFSNEGYGICYNGTVWLAGGSYTGASGNTMAYSVDGITWTGIGRPVFTTACYDVAMNGSYWFAVGEGGNSIAYTTTVNGSAGWTGLGTSIFSTAGTGVAWNGQLFVFTGRGGNSLAYGNSISSPTISGVTNSTQLLASGTGVCWNGVRFIAAGSVTTGTTGNTLAYSRDGINWYPGYVGISSDLTSSIFTVNANCVASNPGVGFPVFDSQIVLDPNGITETDTLDFFTEGYHQQGFSQISIQVNVNNIV